MTIWDMMVRIEQLEAIDLESEQLLDYEEIIEHLLYVKASRGEAMNDEYRDVTAGIDPESHYTPEHFPRDWFMEFQPTTPRFGVGDIVFKLDWTDADPEKPYLEEVVVTCVMCDIFGVTYLVAPHNVKEVMCTSDILEVDEDMLSFRKQELDPRRKHLELVK